MIAQAPGQAWGRWAESQQHPHHSINTYYAMDISGLIQSYDSRAASPVPLNRTTMPPQYVPSFRYSSAPSGDHVVPRQDLQQNPFSYNPYAGGNINIVVPGPAYSNDYAQQRPLSRSTRLEADETCRLLYSRNDRQRFVEELPSQRPPIKLEAWTNPSVNSPPLSSSNTKIGSPTSSISSTNEKTFDTEVDTLMRAIQAKEQSSQPQITSSVKENKSVVGAHLNHLHNHGALQTGMGVHVPKSPFKLTHGDSQDGISRTGDDRKRYICTMKDCSKSFFQKTHRDIHERSHTGSKPYVSYITSVIRSC